MGASASEALESPVGNILFSLNPILVDLKGGRYVGPIVPIQLADLVSGGGRIIGSKKNRAKSVAATAAAAVTIAAEVPRKNEKKTLLGGEV